MDPQSRDELHDEVLAEEIRLLGELVLAASSVTRHLSEEEVDQILDAQRSPQNHSHRRRRLRAPP